MSRSSEFAPPVHHSALPVVLMVVFAVAAIAFLMWHELHPGVLRDAIARLAEWERNLWRPR